MSTAELLFELASDERLKILAEIDKNPLRMSEVALKLSATVQETSRHLERLAGACLVSKDSESRYGLTSFGKLAVSLLASFRLLRDERDYFLSHDLSGLPVAFLHRIGELLDHRDIKQLDEAIAHAEDVIKGAKGYVWLMADQALRQSFPHEHPESVSFRLILPKDIDSEAIRRVRSRIGAGLQIARVSDIRVAVVMNERVAAVYFPSLDGRMDFTRGFAGETSEFHGWCSDLYNFYWNRAHEGD